MKYPFSESFYARSKKEGRGRRPAAEGQDGRGHSEPHLHDREVRQRKGSNRVFSMVRNSPVVACPSGGKNVINVEEAARGMVMALEGGKNGEKYLICGANYSYSELFHTIAAHFGLRRCYLGLPDWLLKLAGHLGDLLGRCGLKVEFGSVNMRILMIKNYYSTDKAFRDFGFRPGRLFGESKS